ncbi:MAG: hypothetical protein SOI13_01585 [Bifidobacterium mongoliense]|jgi:hypothetical protein|uniref:hypothetical protein n=1 Tax=Bifidobacterium mongoliense TaxID=518643 RepID=UPI002F3540BE
MPDSVNLIENAADDDQDAATLTKLANQLVARIPRLCELKAVYDGEEKVPGQHLPKNLRNSQAGEVFVRNMRIASLNVAQPMVDSVTIRQRPNGFRSISDSTVRRAAADAMWRQCHMKVKARNLFHYRNLYGEAFAMVGAGHGDDYVTILSPWECAMDANHDSALIYQYDGVGKRDVLTLFQLTRDDDGFPNKLYSRTAFSPSDTRSILSEDDDDLVYALANGEDTTQYHFGSTFQWEDSGPSEQWDYALSNGTLPVWRFATANNRGLFESHLSSIYRIDQQIFDRVTITMMQAFVQRALKGFKRMTYAENDPAVLAGLKKKGDPIDMSSVFEQSPAALWLLPDGVDVWESKVVDITPLNTVITSDMKSLADVALTPLGINSNDTGGSASGADLKRESVLFKAEDLNERADDGLVNVMRMALAVDGKQSDSSDDFETMWLPIQPVQFSDPADAASKLAPVLPAESIWTKVLGFTEQDVAEAQREKDGESLLDVPSQDGTDLAAGASDDAVQSIEPTDTDDGGDQSAGGVS